MAKFRKKPIVIEAVQFNPHMPIASWPASVIPWGDVRPRDMSWGFISTPEGGTHVEGDMHVQSGDWIITGVNGEVYNCKPDIFDKTYELVEDRSVVGCWDCGKPYPFELDVTLPTDQWLLVSAGASLLCTSCILIRAKKLLGVTAARLVLDDPEALQTGITPETTEWQPGRWIKRIKTYEPVEESEQ